jgi:hypothetical protein
MKLPEIKYRRDLYQLLPPNPVTAEIGVAEGFFSRDIIETCKSSLHYCIDSWEQLPQTGDGGFDQEWHTKNYGATVSLLKPYGDRVHILRGLSWRMAQHVPDNSLDLLYIDGDHSYEGVKKDLESWYPKVKPGAVIAGHDFINPAYGVFEAVGHFTQARSIKVFVIKEDHDADAGFYFHKPK